MKTNYSNFDSNIKGNSPPPHDFLTSLYQNLTVGIYRTTPEGKILLANPALIKMLGFNSLEDLANRNLELEGFNSLDSRKRFKNQFDSKDEINRFEAVWQKKDGSHIFVLESARAVKDGNGNIIYFDGTVEDITYLKRNELFLKESEEKYRNLMEEDLTADFITNVDGNLLICNAAFLNMFGFSSKEEAMKTNVVELYQSNEQRENLLSFLRKNKKIELAEIDLIKRDGNSITVLENIVGVFDENNELLQIKGYMFDITARNQAQQKLVESEAKYRQVIENASEFIFITDAKGNFTYANEAGIKASGYTLEEIKSFNYLDLVEKNHKRRVASFYNNQRKNKRLESTLEFPYYSKNGIVRWLEQNVKLLLNGENITGYQLISRDITERKIAEKELHDQTKLLTNILNILPVGLWITDKDGKIVHGNPAGQKIWTGAKYIGIENFGEYKGWWLASGKQIEPEEWAAARAITKKETSINEEIEIECFDGTRKFILNSAVPIINSQNEVIASVVVNEDITENKKSEQALKESESKFRVLTETTSSAIFMFRGEKMIYANPASENLSGFSYDEIMNMNFWDIIHPDYKDIVKERGFARQQGEHVPTRYELKIIQKNGYEKWIEFSAGLISYKGKPTVLGTAFDITDRKLAEEEIQLLSRVVDESPVAIVITDPIGNIEYTNPKFSELSGYSFDEVKGKNPNILKSGLTPNHIYDELWSTLDSGKTWYGELINKKKTGEIYYESEIILPIKNGKLTHYVALKEDITEKKKMLEELIAAKEKAEESDKLKSQFLAQMSHEIRTPINVLVGNHSLIRDFVHEDFRLEYKDIFDGINSSSHRIIRTIDLILNVAEMQSGRYEPYLMDINIDEEIFSRLLSEFKSSLEIKGLLINYENKLRKNTIKADEYSIMQIFANLLDNAIKYTHKGYISIKLYDSDMHHISVEITDTGIGMSDEFLKNLFQPFNQEEKGYSRTYEGNGLGLSLVKEYCKINNAHIEVESKKNIGTTFRVTFNKTA